MHDTLTSTFKIDLGRDIELENNIWAYGGGSLLYWTTNKPEYHEFDVHHNIFLVVNEKLMGGGGWSNGNPNMTFENNLYWDLRNSKEQFLFRYKNFTAWNKLGHDLKSLFADPMFTDHTKRDFTFKKKTNVNKIGFKEFELKFGIVGENYWLKLANSEENNQFHPNQVLHPNYFFTSGSTDFEKNVSFWNNCIMNPHDSVIERSDLNKYNGKNSLRFAPSSKQKHSNTRPQFVIPCNYYQGHGVFSFLFYVSSIKNYFTVDFDSFLSISVSNGNAKGGLFTYKENTWNNLTIYIDFGDAKTNSIYYIKMNGERKSGGEISYSTLSSFMITIVESTADTYIAELTDKIDNKIPNYFRDVFNDNAQIFGSIKYEELDIIENEKTKDGNNNNILYVFIIIVSILILVIGINFLC